jgi:hypothetical protein
MNDSVSFDAVPGIACHIALRAGVGRRDGKETDDYLSNPNSLFISIAPRPPATTKVKIAGT